MVSAKSPLENHRRPPFFRLESVDRIGSIPIVETGLKRVENVYDRIKTNNRLFNWYFETAEATLFAAIESFQPAIKLFETPLKRFDHAVCRSLDVIEQRAPLVYLPPEMMYWNTREYMSDRIVKPVIKRADSVKQIGNAVLESQLTTYAADRIDGAITVADKYVDRYLTLDGEADQVDAKADEKDEAEVENNEKAAMKAIHHSKRFSRKLKRRLTQRTLAEARALRKQTKEAIHVLIYAAELIVKDPKEALAKGKELWQYLSKDEPENQARPQTLEQLIVLLTRESARRVVHLLNYSGGLGTNVSKAVLHSSTRILHQFVEACTRLVKLTKLDTVKSKTTEESKSLITKANNLYGYLQNYTTNSLERFAVFLSGRIEAEKITVTTTAPRRRTHNRANNNPVQNSINGVY